MAACCRPDLPRTGQGQWLEEVIAVQRRQPSASTSPSPSDHPGPDDAHQPDTASTASAAIRCNTAATP
eukprot:11537810-Alexandrium_andersonii.AAC.1